MVDQSWGRAARGGDGRGNENDLGEACRNGRGGTDLDASGFRLERDRHIDAVGVRLACGKRASFLCGHGLGMREVTLQSRPTLRNKAARALWLVVWSLLFRPSP